MVCAKMSSLDNIIELALKQVKPYMRMHKGKLERVSGYVYDTHSGRRITLHGAVKPTGHQARVAEASSVDSSTYTHLRASGKGHRAAMHVAVVKELAKAAKDHADSTNSSRLPTTDLPGTVEREGGFTFNPRTKNLVKVGEQAGFAIAVPHTEVTLGQNLNHVELLSAIEKVTTKNRVALSQEDHYIGGWTSPERGFMAELSQISVIPKNRAVAVGTARNQEGILNMKTGEFLDTGGTGG